MTSSYDLIRTMLSTVDMKSAPNAVLFKTEQATCLFLRQVNGYAGVPIADESGWAARNCVTIQFNGPSGGRVNPWYGQEFLFNGPDKGPKSHAKPHDLEDKMTHREQGNSLIMALINAKGDMPMEMINKEIHRVVPGFSFGGKSTKVGHAEAMTAGVPLYILEHAEVMGLGIKVNVKERIESVARAKTMAVTTGGWDDVANSLAANFGVPSGLVMLAKKSGITIVRRKRTYVVGDDSPVTSKVLQAG